MSCNQVLLEVTPVELSSFKNHEYFFSYTPSPKFLSSFCCALQIMSIFVLYACLCVRFFLVVVSK